MTVACMRNLDGCIPHVTHRETVCVCSWVHAFVLNSAISSHRIQRIHKKYRTISTYDTSSSIVCVWDVCICVCEMWIRMKAIERDSMCLCRLQCDWMSHAFKFHSQATTNEIMTNIIRIFRLLLFTYKYYW